MSPTRRAVVTEEIEYEFEHGVTYYLGETTSPSLRAGSESEVTIYLNENGRRGTTLQTWVTPITAGPATRVIIRK